MHDNQTIVSMQKTYYNFKQDVRHSGYYDFGLEAERAPAKALDEVSPHLTPKL